MPELPEVEWVRRGLEAARLRAPIERVYRSRKPLRTGSHWRVERVRSLVGHTPGPVARRGKHLVWTMSRAGQPDLALLVHLGMTGQLQVVDASTPRLPHTHVELELEDGRAVRFVDPRRFGGVRVAAPQVLWSSPPLCDLGPEPLEPGFDGEALAAAARGRSRPLWPLLLDQTIVAGLGNIYVLEALYGAGLHPMTPAHRLRSGAWARLARAIQAVLEAGLAHGGTTLRDYRRVDGTEGDNTSSLRVYGRAHERCSCGAVLRPIQNGGRSGAYCPREQRRRRGRIAR